MAPPEPDGAAGTGSALEAIIRLTCPQDPSAAGLAQRLIECFGSLGDVLAASTTDRRAILAERPQIEGALQAVSLAIIQVLQARFSQRQILSCDNSVIDYLRVRMAFDRIERLRVLFLNATNHLLADEEMGSGTVGTVHAYPREIMRRCLELGATAIVLAHNHPSGDPSPSREDRLLTDRIVQAAACFEVTVHDHLIVARSGSMSFRRAGYL